MTPSSPSPSPELTEALGLAQRLGALGPGPIDAVIEHARGFVAALAEVSGTVVDLGSGGGVPGFVIAIDRPDLAVVLVDRRQQRTDLARRLVARLGLSGRVRVVTADATDTRALAEVVPVEAVVARGFGPPMYTARCAAPLLTPGGLLVISEPPSGDRWDEAALAALGMERVGWVESTSRVVVLRRRHPVGADDVPPPEAPDP